jgi:hypothetical protein
MALEFSKTAKHVLENTGGYSRQLISYWEKQGYVPAKHLLTVRDLLGLTVEELLGDDFPEKKN